MKQKSASSLSENSPKKEDSDQKLTSCTIVKRRKSKEAERASCCASWLGYRLMSLRLLGRIPIFCRYIHRGECLYFPGFRISGIFAKKGGAYKSETCPFLISVCSEKGSLLPALMKRGSSVSQTCVLSSLPVKATVSA